MKVNRYVLRVTLSLAFLCCNSTVYSNEKTPESITVGIAEWPPWKVFINSGFVGIDIDLLEGISNLTGIEFIYTTCSWRRCILLAENGDVDLVTGVFRRPDREKFLHFIEPSFTRQRIAFYKNSDSNIHIRNYQDLYGKLIGTVRGSVYFEQFDKDQDLKKELVTEDIQLVRMLALGRLDLAIGEEVSFDYLIDQEALSDSIVKSIYTVPTNEEMYLAMSKASKKHELIPILGEAIRSLQREKVIESIIYRHSHSKELEKANNWKGSK